MDKMTTFKITFSKIIYILAVAVFPLCGISVALSVYRIVNFGITSFTDVLKYPFLILVSLFLIAVVVALLIKSQYVVKPNTLVVQYGFIKSSFDLKAVTSMTLDLTTNKLTIYTGEQFLVLATDREWSETFIRAILDENPSIEYTYVFSEPENKKEK